MSNHEYSQGICQDGAAILKDGEPMTIEEILEELKAARAQQAGSGEAVAYTSQCVLDGLAFNRANDFPAGGTVLATNLGGGRIPLYTHPSASVPEVADEKMLTEGVEAMIRGLKKFPGNYTQVVSNIWEDMAAAANPPAEGAE